jgi:uncharacterized membrane protein
MPRFPPNAPFAAQLPWHRETAGEKYAAQFATRWRSGVIARLIRTYSDARASAGLGTRILWWAIPIAATLSAIVLLVKVTLLLRHLLGDGLPGPNFYKLHKNVAHPGFFSIHASMSVLALLIGAAQLSKALRAARPRLHRWLGRIYVGLVIPSAASSLVLAPRVDTLGLPFIMSLMGVLWLTFTIVGVVAIYRRDVAAHRRWMLRSYALTFGGGVLFGLNYYVLGMQLGIAIEYSYPVSVWLAAITSLTFVETWLWRSGPRVSRSVERRRPSERRGEFDLAARAGLSTAQPS